MTAVWDHINSPDHDVDDCEYQQDLVAGLVVRPTEEENK